MKIVRPEKKIEKKVGDVVITMYYKLFGGTYRLFKQEFESANSFKNAVFEWASIGAAEAYAGDEACWDFNETMEEIDEYYMEKAVQHLVSIGFKESEI